MTNFLIFLSPLFLFFYCFVVGYAGFSLLNTKRTTLKNLLFAPALGLSIVIIAVFSLSWFGLPTKIFALPLSLSLLCVSFAILCYQKPLMPWRRYALFLILLPLALIITARPLLHLGFSWLGYLNDDMLNYCLSATYFLNHGYFGPPDITAAVQGKAYSDFYWFMHVPGLWRSGSELLLSWVSGTTGLKPLQIFMPTIIALHLMIIHSVAGMMYTCRKNWRLPFFSALMYSVSGLANLGIFYQLIAQADGLVLFVTCTSFFLRDSLPKYAYGLIRYGILCALLASAFAIFYPELFSLFALALILYFGVLLIQRRWQKGQLRNFFVLTSIVGAGFLVLLHSYFFHFLIIVLAQVSHAGTKINIATALFPYFLIPSGLSNLWGFFTIMDTPQEPWLSLSILASFGLLFTIIAFSFKKLWQTRNACANTALAILMLIFYFFIKNGDFI